jgi:DNA-binding MarR family transcriptional regulator
MTDDAFGWRQQPGRRTSILFDVFVLGQRTRALVGAAMRDAGLRPDEYAAYSVVFEMGPITLTEMAGQLGMPVTTVAVYVRAMEDRGHVRKERHPSDRRAHRLVLTSAGLRAHRRASRSFQRAYRALVHELPIDEGRARDVLQTLSSSARRALAALLAADRAG